MDSITPDTKIFFKATATKGKAISQWTNIDAQSEDASIAILTIKANTTVNAFFDNTYKLTIVPNPAGGTITAYKDASRLIPISDFDNIVNGRTVYIGINPEIGTTINSIVGVDNNNSDYTQASLLMNTHKEVSIVVKAIEPSTDLIYSVYEDHAVVIGFRKAALTDISSACHLCGRARN